MKRENVKTFHNMPMTRSHTEPLADTLTFASQLAREAGALLMRYQREGFAVMHKGDIDLVTTADHASEQLIVEAISARYPSHVIMSEEDTRAVIASNLPSMAEMASSSHEETVELLTMTASQGMVWYIDPLDGTTDFVHRYPNFAVSIALYANGEATLAVVYDPTRDELFSAQQGQGATLNGQPIAVSPTRILIESLLTSGFPYDVLESGRNIASFERLSLLSRGVRISGSAALDLTWLACGRLDGYWEPELKPWDAAAGALIVRAAGGRVTDDAGQFWSPASPSIVASNGALHEVLLQEITGG